MSPGDEYERRLSLWEARVARCDVLQGRVGAARLVLAALAIVVGWESLHARVISGAWLLVPVALFVGAVIYHARERARGARAARAAAYYRKGLGRLRDSWAGAGRSGDRFFDPHHVYAADLDLFGRGGLFELLCAARTRVGEETLARWLLGPATLEQIHQRHAAIEDLRDRLDLREEAWVLPGDAEPAAESAALLAWAESANLLERPWIRWAAISLPVLCAASLAVWAIFATPLPFVIVLLIELALLHGLRAPLAQVLAERAFDDLKTCSLLLARIEREAFQAPSLQALVRGLSMRGHGAADSLERLVSIAQLAGSRDNMLVRIVSLPILYPLHVAFAAERWRTLHGREVRAWIDAVGRFEALTSLAQYRFEHPEDPFPQFLERPQPLLEALQLGHPLIPTGQCVRNDLAISLPARALLVSGSNMSGKSTLLRAVGTNVVLAMAGAPVRARSLRLTPLHVAASLRVNDSLAEGSSRFYAEIIRLRQVYELAAGSPPVLFLLDEILQGTHSWDRRIGAEALVRALLGRNAIGLLSTHDLALTQIDGVAEGTLCNVHFRDELQDGHMTFDFKLRDGVVAKSNGLELMRSIGLEI